MLSSSSRLDLLDAVHLHLDLQASVRRPGPPHGRGHAAVHRHMIVLDQRSVIQAHAVVVCPAHARGIFVEHAQPG
jgi:hypothetical protein